MAKTPFELRYQTLELARQHLMEKFYADLEIFRTNAERVPASKLQAVVYPTPDEVMELATKFRSFVDDMR
jgi:hypothetical protein